MRYVGTLWLVLILLCMVSTSCFADGDVFDSPQMNYERAVLWLREGKYRMALALFEDLQAYQDSDSYALYTQAMLLTEAMQWSDAQIIFRTLARNDFYDSANMSEYVEARHLEENGEIEQAIRLYRKLTVLDSDDRADGLDEQILRIPQTPKNITVQGDFDGIHLQWEMVDQADEYAVYRSMFSGYGYVEIARTNAKTYHDVSICANKTYYYKVTARVGENESPTSDVYGAEKTVSENIDPPASIFIASNGSTASLAWSPVASAIGYCIYRSVSEFGEYALIGSSTDISYKDKNAGKICFYRISARDIAGESLPSTPVTHNDASAGIIKDALLSSVQAIETSATSALFSWDGAADGVFVVQYWVNAQRSAVRLPVQGLLLSLDALAPDTDYRFSITEVSTGVSTEIKLITPAAEAFSTYNYRRKRCNVYWVQNGTGDFWQRNRTRTQSASRDKLLVQNAQGSYYVVLEFSWSRTKENKEWRELWVMRTPCGDAFTYTQKGTCAGGWSSVYSAFPVASLTEKYGEEAIKWEEGTYRFEVYFDGELAGVTDLALN